MRQILRRVCGVEQAETGFQKGRLRERIQVRRKWRTSDHGSAKVNAL